MRRVTDWFQHRPVFACLLIAAAVTVPGYLRLEYGVNKAQDAIDRIEEARTEGQVAACENAVDNAEKINALNDRTQDLLRTVLGGASNPEAIEFIEVQIALYEAVKVPYRDCTAEGIALFYDSGGVAGFLPLGSSPP